MRAVKYLKHLTDTARALSGIPIQVGQVDRCNCEDFLDPGRREEKQEALEDGFSTPAAIFTLK